MAVTSVTDHPDSGAGRRTFDERTYVRKLIVRTNSRSDGPTVVLASASVPRFGSTYSYRGELDVGAICQNLSVDPYEGGLIPSGRIFLVTAEYSTKYGEREKNDQEENPLAVPARLMGSGTQEFRKIVEKDKDGTQVVNGAGDRFLDPPEIEKYYRRLVIVNNEAYVDEDKIETYVGSVNNATWRGGSARKWLMANISHSEARWQAGIRYYEFQYECLKNADTWDLAIMNVGCRQVVGGVLKNIKDDEHNDVTVPAKLSSAGTVLLVSCNANYIAVRARPEKTWATLGIESAN